MKNGILIICIAFVFSIANAQQWIPDPQNKFKVIGTIHTLYTVNDSLYASGMFSHIGNYAVNHIGKYHNGVWTPLRSGTEGMVSAFLNHEGNLYATGDIYPMNQPYVTVEGTLGLARWEYASQSWKPIGNNSDCAVICGNGLEFYDNKIIVVGNINEIAGVPVFYAGGFNGVNWSSVNNNSISICYSLKRFNSDLFASGYPDMFYKYEGNKTWSLYPYGINGYFWIMEIDTFNNFLYLSGGSGYYPYGEFSMESKGIVMWDGFQLHSMGNYVYDDAVGDMAVYNGHLYAVHGMYNVLTDGTVVNRIAYWDWDTFRWYPMGSGVDNDIISIAEFRDTLFLGGLFTVAGDDSCSGFARWYMPDTNCKYMRPLIHTLAMQDTFYLNQGLAEVFFYNNNSYANSWHWNFNDGNVDTIQNPVHLYNQSGNFTVSVVVSHEGCVKVAQKDIVILNSSQSVEYNINDFQFNIFPNPTTSDITVECIVPVDLFEPELLIFDNTGHLQTGAILSPYFNKLNISTTAWKTGNYNICIFSHGEKVFCKKIVKE